MGLGPIPRSSIMAYAAEQGLFGDAADHFASIIRRVDIFYLRMSNSVKPKKELAAAEEVSVTDVEGSKHVMQRLAARSKVKRGSS